ncbi:MULTISPECIES: formate dehydrogenase accessory sulfurtransferase FdhD [Bacillus]|uniref:Sulfur carrier protein FdhD n=1 Tax=Bacillus pseudomycoides TaxID=64104 RepID=A0A1Y3MHK5_9BACI|nr:MULTISPECIES: formate dehydrogenase accessory sulfurtransferase FdhD [Bacillus cereus group]EOP61055.1 formate dehydrogenase family accessory protein FdhD [Bacillus cereus VD136]EOP76168.1 formate dehydrogenase family accessory protein FdhD [Bacillus cereus VDM006]EOQ15834.1 formate dehydrogenase family accessory protein FdhD [Bacillus cereus VDM021]OOG92247.1 Formate dehydrogenase chain D [Bacillus mycoides]MDF2086549.1 formate dehydrogenase accessory sulfurtransferase FdhD [Bacillus pseud
MGSVQETCKMVRYQAGIFLEQEDEIVTEYPVTIKLNGEEYVTVVCTPNYIEDMVIGFLISEGIIASYENIDELWIQKDKGVVHVKTSQINPLYQTLYNKRYVTSCCGKSRQGFVFVNDAAKAKTLHDIHVTITPEECFHLMNSLQQSSTTFRQTGGVHNTALCDRNTVLISRMDIGRHNALDKIYGHCLRNHIPIKGKIIVFSGRISSEILLKVSKIGCEIVLSKSAPTKLALQLAHDLGITVVGFIRNDSCNIYTHPERVEGYIIETK